MTRKTQQIYLGTMSGTSMDGLDLVAVKFKKGHPKLLSRKNTPFPDDLRKSLQNLVIRPEATITKMCELDTWLGQFYSNEINTFIKNNKLKRKSITAIGSHGQTIRHSIQQETAYSLQIGDPNIIAAQTGLTVVADFRRRDLALGGQGAPLAPAFHNYVFRSDKLNRVIINIGGISNITYLPADKSLPVTGFDTGPGNTLLDHISRHFLQTNYDHNGKFALSGKIHQPTLQVMLKQEPFFNLNPPKSTGTDYFSPAWLNGFEINKLSPADSMATLAELTVLGITKGIQSLKNPVDECFVCGGGAHNHYLMDRLKLHLKDTSVKTTKYLGIHPDWVEAIAFAWLARQTIHQLPGNLPSVTSAKVATILGGVYF